MKSSRTDRVHAVAMWLLLASPFLSIGSGCGHRGGVVGETSEYSYEDVQAQIRAEEEASKAEREAEEKAQR